VRDGNLSIHIQPIIDVASGLIVSGEVLMRWRYRGKNISPTEFIPVAGMTGSIRQLGGWVFEKAYEVIKSFKQDLSKDMIPNLVI
jgi:EAL domain-containing protein (putative c-di-GMP-specific phosphodiesterase class I)